MRIAAVGDLHCRADTRRNIAVALSGVDQEAEVLLLAGDLTGKVNLDNALVFNFTNAVRTLRGSVLLNGGTLLPHGLGAPSLGVLSASATIKGNMKDAFKLTVAFTTERPVISRVVIETSGVTTSRSTTERI